MSSLPCSVRPGDLVRIRGERWRITRCRAAEDVILIETDGCDALNRGTQSRFLLPFEPTERVDVSRVPRIVRPTEWRTVARRVLADATPSWTALSAAVRARLDVVPFQLEPAIALLRGDACRFLIADGVGLGKTVQAALMIAELLRRHADARAIVVCPAGLREQWREELHTRFDLRADNFDAAGVARMTASLPMGFNPWATSSLVITSIDYVKRPEVVRCLEPLIWDLVIFDEAHALAGRSDRAIAAAALASRARIVVMLTATPHSGDAEAFRRLCDIGRHGPDDPLLLFNRTHRAGGASRPRKSIILRIRPTAEERAMHAALEEYARLVWRAATSAGGAGARLAMSVLTRRASSSATSLERSIERRMTLVSNPQESRAAQLDLPFGGAAFDDEEPVALLAMPGLNDAGEECAQLSRILRLAHEASRTESKLLALRRLIARTNESAIVFTEYRDTLDRIALVLPDVAVARLHGGLTSRQRTDALRQFAEGSARVLLATDAASEGLNLHHQCRLVVNLEMPWTPVRLEQRAGRVDRMGQRRRVHAVHLVAATTSEELVLSKLVNRVHTVRAAMGPMALASLPTDLDVGAAVFGGAPLPEPSITSQFDASVISPDLVSDGRAEAVRIEGARALLTRAATRPADGRPALTFLARGHRFGRRARVWLFKLLIVDRQGRSLRDHLFALSAPHEAAAPARTASAVRELLNFDDADLKQVAARARDECLRAFVHELEAPTRVWLQREESLSQQLHSSQARLSAQLIQPGLFDRRMERATGEQAALLDQALGWSRARAIELVDRNGPQVDSCDLVLAVAFE